MNPLVLIPFGVLVGVFSGFLGIGGGAVMIPVMVWALGFTQIEAQATSLAVMMLPGTLPAVIRYYQSGDAKVKVALWIALGVVMGSFFGAVLAKRLEPNTVKLFFGIFLIYVAGYTAFSTLGKEHFQRSVIMAAGLVLIGAILYLGARYQDRRATAADAGAPSESMAMR